MTPLYLYLLIASVSGPLFLSIFFPDVIKNWGKFILSTTLIAAVFLVWDAIFTANGVWGFNDDYILGFSFFGMPIEEWLFFLVIPFCSIYLHFAIDRHFPNLKLGKNLTIYLTIILLVLLSIVLFMNLSKAYTAVNYSFLLLTMILGLIFHIKLLQQFYLTLIVILIPFLIVNGILTGVITEEPVVWYNDAENLGIRIITIPIEDIGYAFTMLFGNLMIFETLRSKKS
ncbi:MAG: lycopene cyclase domain-containing protein [Crocinitomicaceae bacterium]|jgi:lycopene cyclase domain-containing protein|nr:lycopene cyclase domain-containing protein [Crocinitomicaceae bacterium]MDG1657248.1 lycopene cyclase domain-containing protein [Crocinitomicaceae bacterium]|tara:strand:- start:376 stop:1059 length:684 start_codon:yes stop_codon:yes gene_type:complete